MVDFSKKYKVIFALNTANTDMGIKRLSELKKGESGKILYLTDDAIGEKLMILGCLPGEMVVVNRAAPLGDPIAILIAGNILSIRKKEAEKIFISPANSH